MCVLSYGDIFQHDRSYMTNKKSNLRKTGTHYEKLAGALLTEKGYVIRQYNFRCPYAEIDIVAEHEGFLVFCEVKYRSCKRAGSSLEAVDAKKQKRISRGALFYMQKEHLSHMPCRFDVVGIDEGKVTVLTDAFPFRC